MNKKSTPLANLQERIHAVMEAYKISHPEVIVDKDYFLLKVTEEWGECVQSYLMKTERGRRKGKTDAELQKDLQDEFADVLGFLILFAQHEGIDPEQALNEKWFKYLT